MKFFDHNLATRYCRSANDDFQSYLLAGREQLHNILRKSDRRSRPAAHRLNEQTNCGLEFDQHFGGYYEIASGPISEVSGGLQHQDQSPQSVLTTDQPRSFVSKRRASAQRLHAYLKHFKGEK
jgi:hypothetical protein